MKPKLIISLSIIIGFSSLLVGCGVFSASKKVSAEEDSFGCKVPAQVVERNKPDLKMAGAKLGEFALGQLDYKNEPELVRVMTDAANNSMTVDYLVCEAKGRGDIDPNSPEQVDYVRFFFAFLHSKPTPQEIAEWRNQNPFPSELLSNQQVKFIALGLTKFEKMFLALGYQSGERGLPDEYAATVTQKYADDLGKMPEGPLTALTVTTHTSLVAKDLIEDSPIERGKSYSQFTFSIKITQKGEKAFLYLVKNRKL